MLKCKILFPLSILFMVSQLDAKTSPEVIQRHYSEGTVMKYKLVMNYTQSDRPDSERVSQATLTVKKSSVNVFYEDIQWSDIVENGAVVPLSKEQADFRQQVSLDPAYKLSIPDLSKVVPLIESITDMLTFYSDLYLAIKKEVPLKKGQHLYVSHGTPNSWAGGPTLVGYDCIDFDITVTEVNKKQGFAVVRVQHLPPPGSCGKPPAPWMEKPVSDTPNNWYQVQKSGEAGYDAGVAKETFDDVIKFSLKDGRILYATQINPLVGETRLCKDAALSDCGKPEKFTINRRLVLSPLAEK